MMGKLLHPEHPFDKQHDSVDSLFTKSKAESLGAECTA
jgi:hypothetical protein